MPVPLIQKRSIRGRGQIEHTPNGYIITMEDGQRYLAQKTEKTGKVVVGQPVLVKLSSTGTEIYYVGPWDGIYQARFKGFYRAEESDKPEPVFQQGGEKRRTKAGGVYTTKDRWSFSLIFNLLTPPFEEIETARYFSYDFAQVGGDIAISGGKSARRLWSTLTVMGMNLETESIPASPDGNVLPWLEARLMQSPNQDYLLVFQEGWVNDIYKDYAGTEEVTQTPAAVQMVEGSPPDPRPVTPAAPTPTPLPVQPVEQTPTVQPLTPVVTQVTVPEISQPLTRKIEQTNTPVPVIPVVSQDPTGTVIPVPTESEASVETPPVNFPGAKTEGDIPLPGLTLDFDLDSEDES